MILSDYLNTFGQYMLARHGERVHKIAIDAAFTCPNRDGSKGVGGCTFCNNVSFSPNSRSPESIADQITAGKKVIRKRTGARKFLAYFQAYTNTYDEVSKLKSLYDQALNQTDVIGLCIGTRPDCVSTEVLNLLKSYQDDGYEIWLELGLQSAFDESLRRVNRGHGFKEYQVTVNAARKLNIKVCTHLIIGLPGETAEHNMQSLKQVLHEGTDGLKLHPLHVVKGTALANEWRRGEYQAIELEEYTRIVADIVEATPKDIIFHRLTGTASTDILLAPKWCNKKWLVLNMIAQELEQRQLKPETKNIDMEKIKHGTGMPRRQSTFT